MKKILTILTVLLAVTLISSCQKELPDSFKNVEVNKGENNTNPSPTPTPSDPSQQGTVPSEEDNPMPSY